MFNKIFWLTKKVIPKPIKKWIANLILGFRVRRIKKEQLRALMRVRKKEVIKVAFFVIHDSVWKYDIVYKLLQSDKRFDPLIVICPYTVNGEEIMLREMEQAYNTFRQKGYNTIKTFNEESKKWLNVKKEIYPDIIFFTNPHKLTKDEYYITNFLDTLTCYVQYSFHITHLHKLQYDQFFHNVLWYAFYETPIHVGFAQKYSRNEGKNVLHTGFPGTDVFLDQDYTPLNRWKIKGSNIKRIIWAPHHTIPEYGAKLNYSNFLDIAEDIFKLLDQFKDKIQIVFKPHPLLRVKLESTKVWGKRKTKAYFDKWEELPNGQLCESVYTDLFLTSDAMIHDSASFMVEYLYTRKPVLFISKDKKIIDRFNDFGKIVYKKHYHAFNTNEIIDFIKKVVLLDNDIKFKERNEFLEKYLLPPNNKFASQNIIDRIKKELHI